MKQQSTPLGLCVKKTTKVHLIIFFLMLCSGIFTQTHAQYVPPTQVDGAAPNGIPWDTVLTGRTLPVRTAATSPFNGVPGAVMFYDKATSKIGINPNGLSVSTVIVTYMPGIVNVSQSNSGPFIYPGGTANNAFSPSTGTFTLLQY